MLVLAVTLINSCFFLLFLAAVRGVVKTHFSKSLEYFLEAAFDTVLELDLDVPKFVQNGSSDALRVQIVVEVRNVGREGGHALKESP